MAQRTVVTHLRAVQAEDSPATFDSPQDPTRIDPRLSEASHRRGEPHGRLLLTFDAAAEMLGIGRTSLYRLVWAGRLTPVRIGRSVRFSFAQLELFVASLENGAC